MRALILFYSRSGTTRLAAEALAHSLGADLSEIGAVRYRMAVLGYVRAAYDSLKRVLPPITVSASLCRSYDLLVLGTPIWTSYPAAPMRAFLSQNPKLPDRVALFVTYGGHSPPEKALDELAALLPDTPVATLALQADEVRAGRTVDVAGSFAGGLLNTPLA